MSTRVNARLAGELSRKLAYLQAHTGKTATEVIHASIELYFEQVAGPAGPKHLLQDFIGCVSAEADLSENYKAALTASLGDKIFGEHVDGPPRRRRRAR